MSMNRVIGLCNNQTILTDHIDGWKMWKKVLFFVALPSFIIGNVNPRYFVMEDGTETEPPYVPYDHLHFWTKVSVRINTYLGSLSKLT